MAAPSLTLDLQDDDAMYQLQGHSITYRIAVGPQQGRKVFTLQTIPSWEDDDVGTNQVGKIAGFSVHAGVATKTRERRKLERLCRYISRPAVSEKRFALTWQGKVSAKGALQRWHDAYHLRTIRFHA
jgi:hypothetical protein